MPFLARTIILLLFISLHLPAQRQGQNMQLVAKFQQTVADFEDYSHSNLALHGVALDGEWMYLNAQITFEGTGLGTRLVVAKMESPWNIAYVADGGGEVFDFPGFARHYGNSVYLTSRNIGGMIKYDVSTPSAPVSDGYIWGPGDLADLVKAGSYLYAVREQVEFGWPPASMLILRDDPSSLTSVAEVAGIGSLRGIATDGSYLFVSSDSIGVDSSGIRILDISQNPEAPDELAILPTAGIPEQLAYDNDNLYIATGDSGLVIVDVTDRDQPQIVSQANYLGALNKMEKRGDLIYSLGTETEDSTSQHYIRVIDVSDVNLPVEVGYHLLDSRPFDMSVEDSLIAVVHDNDVSLYRYVPDAEAILSFSNAPIKQSCTQTATLYQSDELLLHNTGSVDLNISDILTSDSSITVDATSFTLAPGAQRSLTVNFHYLRVATAPDYLVFEHNGAGSPDTVRLHGCDYPQTLYVESDLPNPYSGTDFGILSVGQSIHTSLHPSGRSVGDDYAPDWLVGTVTSEHSDLSITPLEYRIPSDGSMFWDMTFTPSLPGDYSMRLRFDHSGSHRPVYVTYTATVEDDVTGLVEITPIPEEFSLSQNYPNPFNPTTTIEYALPATTDVKIDVFAIDGQQVRTLYRGAQAAGYHNVVWNGKNVAGRQVSSGMYFYRLRAGKEMFVRKMMLMR